jgi:hypothetical protein
MIEKSINDPNYQSILFNNTNIREEENHRIIGNSFSNNL